MSEVITINTINNSFNIEGDKSVLTTIEDFFNYEKNRPSDINEHLETLKRYTSECSHVTEMGVRNVVSTWAFLSGNPKKYVGIDINPSPVELAEELAKEQGIDFNFIQADTIHPDFEIEETDLLFIDTYHVYRQLIKELRIHNVKAKKYIILHDTTCFGDQDQYEEDYSKHLGSSNEKTGLWPAIIEFLAENPNWQLKEVFTRNNGLTILARK